jgi:hypothetical protein
MAKLRRLYEAAAEENRPIDEIALERYGDLESFEQAKEERRILDGRGPRQRDHLQGRDRALPQSGKDEFGRDIRDASREGTPKTTVIYNDPASSTSTRSSSLGSSFRRPGDSEVPHRGARTPTGTGQPSTSSKPSTPIPSVFTPPVMTRKASTLSRPPLNVDDKSGPGFQTRSDLVSERPLSPTSLNRLQAKALKARMMRADDADRLEREYNEELQRAQQGDRGPGGLDQDLVAGGQTEIRVLPTLDAQGRLYDVGRGGKDDDGEVAGPGNRRRKKEKYFETRDPRTGEVLRYNADDDTTSLEELVRQERFRAGKADQKNLDAELAGRIATDSGFQDDLECVPPPAQFSGVTIACTSPSFWLTRLCFCLRYSYMDDSADRLARKKLRSDAQKKMFAINGMWNFWRVAAHSL